MQMRSICVCRAYADAMHMDMFYLCLLLSFSAQIRKIPKPEHLFTGTANTTQYHLNFLPVILVKKGGWRETENAGAEAV